MVRYPRLEKRFGWGLWRTTVLFPVLRIELFWRSQPLKIPKLPLSIWVSAEHNPWAVGKGLVWLLIHGTSTFFTGFRAGQKIRGYTSVLLATSRFMHLMNGFEAQMVRLFCLWEHWEKIT